MISNEQKFSNALETLLSIAYSPTLYNLSGTTKIISLLFTDNACVLDYFYVEGSF